MTKIMNQSKRNKEPAHRTEEEPVSESRETWQIFSWTNNTTDLGVASPPESRTSSRAIVSLSVTVCAEMSTKGGVFRFIGWSLCQNTAGTSVRGPQSTPSCLRNQAHSVDCDDVKQLGTQTDCYAYKDKIAAIVRSKRGKERDRVAHSVLRAYHGQRE